MDYEFAFKPGELDRAAQLRTGNDTRNDAGARTLVFWRGKLLADGDGRPVAVGLDHPALADSREPPVFVGLTPEGPRFAADLPLWSPPEDATTIGQFIDQTQQLHAGFPDARFVEIRGLMPTLSRIEGETVATGRALIGWHATHRFCANCGTASAIESAGWVRKCPQCGTQHFPRTDPVVIMAVTRDDRLLLGRSPSWPERMYSLLAGFVEPGETIEAAVRRETLEESAIKVGPVRYVAAQPWPFPMSLMFGCHGEALSEAITVDPVELSDARWVTRSEVLEILAGTHPEINRPRRGAIAGALIEAWAHGKLLDPDYWGN
ncbi:MAG: pyrophosphatase [Devosia sp.]|uniref:NAD(+) diphosphatase n=1 Tax=Devosia sp. TaxID=1871048 RepID=UPI00261E9557|nr:NAD(+) diphosphatase [Devosia sp.]MDB5541175.1 pyrophosphatase [Devosia sp.]